MFQLTNFDWHEMALIWLNAGDKRRHKHEMTKKIKTDIKEDDLFFNIISQQVMFRDSLLSFQTGNNQIKMNSSWLIMTQKRKT